MKLVLIDNGTYIDIYNDTYNDDGNGIIKKERYENR